MKCNPVQQPWVNLFDNTPEYILDGEKCNCQQASRAYMRTTPELFLLTVHVGMERYYKGKILPSCWHHVCQFEVFLPDISATHTCRAEPFLLEAVCFILFMLFITGQNNPSLHSRGLSGAINATATKLAVSSTFNNGSVPLLLLLLLLSLLVVTTTVE